MIETALSAVYYIAVLLLLLTNAVLWIQDRNANRARAAAIRQLLSQKRDNGSGLEGYIMVHEVRTEIPAEDYAKKIREMLDKVDTLDLPQTDQSATPSNQAPTNRRTRKSTQPKADTTAAPRRTRKVAQQADK